jgi:hypothetical protein
VQYQPSGWPHSRARSAGQGVGPAHARRRDPAPSVPAVEGALDTARHVVTCADAANRATRRCPPRSLGIVSVWTSHPRPPSRSWSSSRWLWGAGGAVVGAAPRRRC